MGNQELSTVMLTNTGSSKKPQSCHHHNQPLGKITWHMKNKGLLRATAGIIQMSHFYLLCVRIFFDMEGTESIFYPSHPR